MTVELAIRIQAKSDEDLHKFTADAKQLMDVIQSAAQYGALIPSELTPILEAVGTVAGVVKNLIDFLDPPEKEDPITKTLGELKNQMTALSDQMRNQFEDMKAFELEKSFIESYNLKLGKLFLFMMDTLTSRKKEAVEHFETAYKEVNPQNLVYDMMSRLAQDNLNPLKKAMDADPLTGKTTFERWLKIFLSVIGQALLLEKFACGLLPNKNDYELKKITEKNDELDELLREWDTEYTRNSKKWWPAKIIEFVHRIQDDSSLDGNEAKLTAIWKRLTDIHTNDQFQVACFKNGLKWHITTPKSDQVIQSLDRGGSNIIVYRSPPVSSDRGNEYKEKLDDPKVDAFGTVGEESSDVADSWFTERIFNRISDALGDKGLFLGIRSGEVAFRATNIGDWKYGPGFVTYDKYVSITAWQSVKSKHFPLFFMIAE